MKSMESCWLPNPTFLENSTSSSQRYRWALIRYKQSGFLLKSGCTRHALIIKTILPARQTLEQRKDLLGKEWPTKFGMLTGYGLGMDLGMDLTSPSFGRNFGPDIRLHGISGTTNGQTYKKKFKLFTGYGFGYGSSPYQIRTKIRPGYPLGNV